MLTVLFLFSGLANIPKIFLNRHKAAEHLVNPSKDPEAKHAIFNQVLYVIVHLLLYRSDGPVVERLPHNR